jgi:hypothetical protein
LVSAKINAEAGWALSANVLKVIKKFSAKK